MKETCGLLKKPTRGWKDSARHTSAQQPWLPRALLFAAFRFPSLKTPGWQLLP